MFKYFIFDLDGTLAYTIGDLRNAMNMTFEKYGFPLVDDAKVLASVNHGTKDFVRKCLPEKTEKTDDFINEVIDEYLKIYGENCLLYTKPYEHVNDILDHCKKNGAKMAVFSNKHDPCTKHIVKTLFPNVFDVVLGGGTEFPHKPQPDGALYIADILGAKPDEVAFIGDSDVDMATAINAGMHPFGVSWGYRPAELLTEKGAEGIISDLDSFLCIANKKV
ncbi:MAG: HAD family hydrolase [Clostridia bacterium]|nr:HAD family hydrolase [Clostridia bacterium]